MKVQPLIAVSDVQRSSRWYQKILKCKSGHGGSEYEQLIEEDDEDFFLQLHLWNAMTTRTWETQMPRRTGTVFCCGSSLMTSPTQSNGLGPSKPRSLRSLM